LTVGEGVLEEIVQSTRAELRERKLSMPLQALADTVADTVADAGAVSERRSQRRLRSALLDSGMAVIAEFKRRSPSAGELRAGAEVAEIVRAYERGGAAALSVLTEGPHFGGSLDDLRDARAASALPILRKDFVVDAYQLYEARAAGADAVLLIVAALEDRELSCLHEQALSLGLDALVEVHDRDELRRALAIGADLIGINNRDLRDFSVDVMRTSQLMSEIPAGVSIVSESGIVSAAQITALAREGVQAVLVGESLMRAEQPELALRELLP
jgi:indole-3-glycerol phosphate synthase